MMLNGNVVPAMSRGFEESDLKILKNRESCNRARHRANSDITGCKSGNYLFLSIL